MILYHDSLKFLSWGFWHPIVKSQRTSIFSRTCLHSNAQKNVVFVVWQWTCSSDSLAHYNAHCSYARLCWLRAFSKPFSDTMWVWPRIVVKMWKSKGQPDATDWFHYCKTYCLLKMFQAPLCPSSGVQELYRWLLPVVLGALVYRSLVWCGAVGYVSGLRDAASFALQVVGLVWSCGLCVMFAGCCSAASRKHYT